MIVAALPADAPIGAKYVDYAGIGGVVYDISITPNRGDATGVYGVARDLCLGLEVVLPSGEVLDDLRKLGAAVKMSPEEWLAVGGY